MSAFAQNEQTCFWTLFVIMNFVDASKKRINPKAKENEKMVKMKMFPSFEQQGF